MTIRTVQVKAQRNGGHDYGLTIDSMYTWMTNQDTMTWVGVGGLVDSFTVKFGNTCPFRNWPNGQMSSTPGDPRPTVQGDLRQVYARPQAFKYSLIVTVLPNGHFQGGSIELDPEVVVDDSGPPPGGRKRPNGLAKVKSRLSGLKAKVGAKVRARATARRARRRPRP
jgi:hypothetical protein